MVKGRVTYPLQHLPKALCLSSAAGASLAFSSPMITETNRRTLSHALYNILLMRQALLQRFPLYHACLGYLLHFSAHTEKYISAGEIRASREGGDYTEETAFFLPPTSFHNSIRFPKARGRVMGQGGSEKKEATPIRI